jgi:hypothetical protein
MLRPASFSGAESLLTHTAYLLMVVSITSPSPALLAVLPLLRLCVHLSLLLRLFLQRHLVESPSGCSVMGREHTAVGERHLEEGGGQRSPCRHLPTSARSAPTSSHKAPTSSHIASTSSHKATTSPHIAPTSSHTAPTSSNQSPTISRRAPTGSHIAPTSSQTAPSSSLTAPYSSPTAPSSSQTAHAQYHPAHTQHIQKPHLSTHQLAHSTH